MKLAVVAGGWHWPSQFYQYLAAQASGADLFVVSHRAPHLPIVAEEKAAILRNAQGPLAELDRQMYSYVPALSVLRSQGWRYEEAPNTVGDWGFFNQWLEKQDYRDYDVILNCHDDTYIRRLDLFQQVKNFPEALIISNGTYPQAPPAYVRGSFEFFTREMLDMIGGRFDLGQISLTREGKIDSPEGIAALSEWNNTALPLRRFMVERGLEKRIAYMSPYYRVSPWAIEGERGFLHYTDGVPWSFEEGLKATEAIEVSRSA